MVMAKSHIRNTAGLRAAAKMKHQRACGRVDNALEQLLRDHHPVNFNVVAAMANVSKAFLYNYYRHEIEVLRQRSSAARSRVPRSQVTDASKDVIIAAKDRRIAELQREVKELRQQIDRLHQKIYEQH